jgi:dihydroorotase
MKPRHLARPGAGPLVRTTGKLDYDVVLLHGRVIDPETKRDSVRSVGVRHGKIAAIEAKELRGKATFDAADHVVCPGFIDPISHGQDLDNDRIQVQDGVTTKLQMEFGVQDIPAFYAAQEGRRLANYGAATAHQWARTTVFGSDQPERVATDAEIAQMAAFLDKNLAEGALGVGFGLEYQPGSTRWEVLEMFRVAGKYRASCHVHTRYGTLLEEQSNFTAVDEVFTAAQAYGAPLQIVHVPSMALASTARVLQILERLQKKHDVTCDFYPYTAFGTWLQSEVFAPGWQQRFGIDYGDLEWAATHERLTKETFEKYRKQGGFVIAHAIPESAVEAAAKSPATMVGSDGGLTAGVGHPRSAGTFARVLGRYVREKGTLTLHDAIEKMTLRPARRFEARCPAFKKKGRLQVGMDADITVFDPATVQDNATFDQPALPSSGFAFVLVGGSPVVAEGQLLDTARPGRGLRAHRKKPA